MIQDSSGSRTTATLMTSSPTSGTGNDCSYQGRALVLVESYHMFLHSVLCTAILGDNPSLYCAPTDRSYLIPSTTWLPFRKYFIASVLWSFKLHGSTTLFGRPSKTAVFPNWPLSHFALGCALWNISTCSLCNPGTSWWTLLYWGETKRKGQEGPLDYMLCRISQWIKFTFTTFLCMWKVAA